MNANTFIKEFFDKKTNLYECFINYIENDDENDLYFNSMLKLISKEKYEQNQEEFRNFLILIVQIANNHHREKDFFDKIFMIILFYSKQIQNNFSNITIFNIFKSCKLILLFLFEKNIIEFDECIFYEIVAMNDYRNFFFPEIKKFADIELIQDIEKNLLSYDSNIFYKFDQKRHIGENDSYICSLIRQDSVEEFVAYVNKANIILSSEIKPSIFETNEILLKNHKATLIEYAAFYGSIQIFNFLRMSSVSLTPTLWIFAIHSKNAELIHILESNKVCPPNGQYEKCLIESIKCHHIQDNK